MSAMLKLPEVTIWTMVWNGDRSWLMKAGQVLRYCAKIMEPARMILFSHERVAPKEYPFEVIQIPKLDWQSYNIFVNRVVPTYLKSGFAMSVHEDGFPLDPARWQPEFLGYDYIGAPWEDGAVGNGGFNIESKRLLALKCAMPLTGEDFTVASDRLVCTTRRAELERQGIRFAPRELALAFSTEQVGNERPSFGFHGRGPAAAKYAAGWEGINTTLVNGFYLEGNKAVPPPSVAPDLGGPGRFAAPKVEIAYVHVLNSPHYRTYAERFVASYLANPPGYEHSTTIICNCGFPTEEVMRIFALLPNCTFFEHDNSGQDIGGYIAAAKVSPADMLVCFGSSVHFFKPGWLRRMARVWEVHGPGLYGSQASYECTVHLNTTGFWCSPKLLASYPHPVITKDDRYNFEHGRAANAVATTPQEKERSANKPLWKQAYRAGLPVLLVTWDGEYRWWDWRRPRNILRRGDQSNLLVWWKHADEYARFDPRGRDQAAQSMDTLTDRDFNLLQRTFK